MGTIYLQRHQIYNLYRYWLYEPLFADKYLTKKKLGISKNLFYLNNINMYPFMMIHHKELKIRETL